LKACLKRLGCRLAIMALAAILLGLPACARRRKEQQDALPPDQLYQMAVQKMERKHYFTARSLLQQVLPKIPPEDRDLLPRVQLAIAESYFRDRGLLNYGEALNGYRNFLTYYPNHEKADLAQYMVGMSLFKQVLAPDRDQALTLKAIDEFRKVETVYPNSAYVEKARRQIDACLDLLAEHERLIGRFYQKRRAWSAAIDRYQTILERYPRFRGTNQVLFDIGQCHLMIGNRLAAEAAFGQLWHDDPHSKLSAQARQIVARADRLEEERKRKESGS